MFAMIYTWSVTRDFLVIITKFDFRDFSSFRAILCSRFSSFRATYRTIYSLGRSVYCFLDLSNFSNFEKGIWGRFVEYYHHIYHFDFSTFWRSSFFKSKFWLTNKAQFEEKVNYDVFPPEDI